MADLDNIIRLTSETPALKDAFSGELEVPPNMREQMQSISGTVTIEPAQGAIGLRIDLKAQCNGAQQVEYSQTGSVTLGDLDTMKTGILNNLAGAIGQVNNQICGPINRGDKPTLDLGAIEAQAPFDVAEVDALTHEAGPSPVPNISETSSRRSV